MAPNAFWILARMCVVVVNVLAAFSTLQGKTNADWRVGLIAGVLGSVGFSVWISVVRHRNDVDMADPYSLTKPFFPINKYPLRSWLLGAFSMTLAGTMGLVGQNAAGVVAGPLPGILFGFGLPLLVTLVTWSKLSATASR
jgi:hypothetical protein